MSKGPDGGGFEPCLQEFLVLRTLTFPSACAPQVFFAPAPVCFVALGKAPDLAGLLPQNDPFLLV